MVLALGFCLIICFCFSDESSSKRVHPGIQCFLGKYMIHNLLTSFALKKNKVIFCQKKKKEGFLWLLFVVFVGSLFPFRFLSMRVI